MITATPAGLTWVSAYEAAEMLERAGLIAVVVDVNTRTLDIEDGTGVTLRAQLPELTAQQAARRVRGDAALVAWAWGLFEVYVSVPKGARTTVKLLDALAERGG
jgi:hypothetical protein